MKLLWEEIESGDKASPDAGAWTTSSVKRLFRAKVPGGWLVLSPAVSITFYPDPEHEWDGNSLP